MSPAAGWTPVEETTSAWTPVEEKTDSYKPGFLHAMGETVLNTLKGIVMPQGVSPYPGMDLEGKQAIAQQSATQMRQRQAEGRSLPYRVIAPIGEAIGVDVAGQEESARHGDPRGVLGHAFGSAGLAASPLAIEGAARVTNRVIPSTARAGRGINALEAPELHGTKPVSPQGAITTLSRFEQELAPTPSVKLHPLLEDFRQRMLTSNVAATHPEVAAQLEASGMPTSNPLTFKEARSFLKRMNEAIPGASKGIERNSLKATAEALDSDIHAMAEQSGFGPDYRRMTREYRRGKQIVRAADEAGPLVGGAIGYEVGSRMGQPLGGTVIGGMAGRAVGKPTLGRVARAIVERDAGAPRLSKPPTPPPDVVTPIAPPAASPQEYTRILLDAKEGKIAPGEADRRIARAGGPVKVKPLIKPSRSPENVTELAKQPEIQGVTALTSKGQVIERWVGEKPIVHNSLKEWVESNGTKVRDLGGGEYEMAVPYRDGFTGRDYVRWERFRTLKEARAILNY